MKGQGMRLKIKKDLSSLEVVLSSLLYGCEGWIFYWHLVRKIGQFCMCCLHKTAGIKWPDSAKYGSFMNMQHPGH